MTAPRDGAPRDRIGVIGVGYVGLVTAVCFAKLGFEVACRDIDPARIERLREGEVPIYEPGLGELMAENAERLFFTTDLHEMLERSDIVFVAVNTPPTYSGDADLSRVYQVVDELQVGPAPSVLVVKSTVPVGTGEKIRAELDRRGLAGVAYASNPEFLREGSAVHDFLHPDRVVVGSAKPAVAERVAALYEPLGAEILRTDVASAEMIKYASNAFLATKISFINEIANVCEEVGADVAVVADGMGRDSRIGPSFLRPGVGYGGSCLVGDETVLVRQDGRIRLTPMETLWGELAVHCPSLGEGGVVAAGGVEVLSWRPGSHRPVFLPVSVATRRLADEVVEVRTKMGRRIRCTPDHPFVVGDGRGGVEIRLADELTTGDWLPLALGRPAMTAPAEDGAVAVTDALRAAGIEERAVRVRVGRTTIDDIRAVGAEGRRHAFDHPRGARARWGDVSRRGTLHLDELRRLGLEDQALTIGTARNGTYIPTSLRLDAEFWRIVGLYCAEGHVTREANGRERIAWSFHPTREAHLVGEVAAFWQSRGIAAATQRLATTHQVSISSRILAASWGYLLGLGRNSYEQRIPDQLWERPPEHQWAFLSGLWEGDGSWSRVAGGPSVVLEWGSVSRELADGVMRMLAGLGLVGSLRVGRATKSTRDTYWVRIAGAHQVEAAIRLVPEHDRAEVLGSIGEQTKRIAPTGHRRDGSGTAWVRVTAVEPRPERQFVYSLEVPDTHTFVATGGLVTHNCFPKDVQALKQLAGNTGYHFQLLTAVVEVNELQKRRVVAKLKQHLGTLRGRQIALLGLSFKPDTDDMREASSLVLGSRLLAEGARVRAYDPVAMEEAAGLLPAVQFASSPEEALADADGAVLVTEWEQFLELDWARLRHTMRNAVLIDGRNALDPDAMRAAGYVYDSIGRP